MNEGVESRAQPRASVTMPWLVTALLAALVAGGISGAMFVRTISEPAIAPSSSAAALEPPVSVPTDLAPSVSLAPPIASSPTPSSPSAREPHPYGPSRRSASAPPRASTRPPTSATCHVVSYFDAEGDKHFRQECP